AHTPPDTVWISKTYTPASYSYHFSAPLILLSEMRRALTAKAIPFRPLCEPCASLCYLFSPLFMPAQFCPRLPRRKMLIASPPAASPATPRRTNPPCTPRRPCISAARIAMEATLPFQLSVAPHEILPNTIPPRKRPTSGPVILRFRIAPLFRWETCQPGNVLRVFERGGRKKAEIGNPNREEDPGKPDDKLSDRGLGTGLRTDPVFLGLQKTRLLDPVMSLPGTNDHPGDYRASGCSACHVIYANDRDPTHSGVYAPFAHSGFSASSDPTIPK